MSDEDGVSSPDEIAVLQAYIDLINSEREAIWARHNALLVANSLIIGALAISPAALWQNKWAALGMISAGAIISAAWLGITLEGWSAMKRHADLARKFASTYFKHLPNALDETLCDHAQTNIHRRLGTDYIDIYRPSRLELDRADRGYRWGDRRHGEGGLRAPHRTF